MDGIAYGQVRFAEPLFAQVVSSFFAHHFTLQIARKLEVATNLKRLFKIQRFSMTAEPLFLISESMN